jgi:hypothetical protein
MSWWMRSMLMGPSCWSNDSMIATLGLVMRIWALRMRARASFKGESAEVPELAAAKGWLDWVAAIM